MGSMAGDGLGAEGISPDEQILRDILGDNAGGDVEVEQYVHSHLSNLHNHGCGILARSVPQVSDTQE